jgi:hypothetical protein
MPTPDIKADDDLAFKVSSGSADMDTADAAPPQITMADLPA